jgi:hypothetical protein
MKNTSHPTWQRWDEEHRRFQADDEDGQKSYVNHTEAQCRGCRDFAQAQRSFFRPTIVSKYERCIDEGAD